MKCRCCQITNKNKDNVGIPYANEKTNKTHMKSYFHVTFLCLIHQFFILFSNQLLAQNSMIVEDFKYQRIFSNQTITDRPSVQNLKLATKIISEIQEVIPCIQMKNRNDIKRLISEHKESWLKKGTMTDEEMDKEMAKLGDIVSARYFLNGSIIEDNGIQSIGITVLDTKKNGSCLSITSTSIDKILWEFARLKFCPWKGTITYEMKSHHDTLYTELPTNGSMTYHIFKNDESTWEFTLGKMIKGPENIYKCKAEVKAEGFDNDIRKGYTSYVNGDGVCLGKDGQVGLTKIWDYNYSWEEEWSGNENVNEVVLRFDLSETGNYYFTIDEAKAVLPSKTKLKEIVVTDCGTTVTDKGSIASFISVIGDITYMYGNTLIGRPGGKNISPKDKTISGQQKWVEGNVRHILKWNLTK